MSTDYKIFIGVALGAFVLLGTLTFGRVKTEVFARIRFSGSRRSVKGIDDGQLF